MKKKNVSYKAKKMLGASLVAAMVVSSTIPAGAIGDDPNPVESEAETKETEAETKETIETESDTKETTETKTETETEKETEKETESETESETETETEAEVEKKDISAAEVSGVEDKIYTGNAIEQDVQVVLDQAVLEKDKDYKVSYQNNEQLGRAEMTITGCGDYEGVIKKSFIISEAEIIESGETDHYFWYLDEAGNVRFIGTGSIQPDWYGKKDIRSQIKKVIMDDAMTEIGVTAFYNCTNLESVHIPEKIEVIGYRAFEGCKKLQDVDLPEGLKEIDRRAFYGCESLNVITVPSTVADLGDSAFSGCTGLTTVNFSKGLKNIGKYAFNGCKSLKDVVLPNGVETIGYSAFYNCSSIETMSIPASVESIDNFAIPKSVTLKVVEGSYGESYAKAHGYKTEGLVDSNGFVYRLYATMLGRTPDETGMETWTQVLNTKEMTGAQVADGFVESDELKNKNLSDEDYIDIMYRTFLDREADPEGKAFWVSILNQGFSRRFIFHGFAESDEFTGICKECGISRGNVVLTEQRDMNLGVTQFVSRCYEKALTRQPDIDGLNLWTGILNEKKQTPKQVAYGFIFSDEVIGKELSDEAYVEMLYRVFMGRDFAPEEVESWVKALTEGSTREKVFDGFADSTEFAIIVQGYGL